MYRYFCMGENRKVPYIKRGWLPMFLISRLTHHDINFLVPISISTRTTVKQRVVLEETKSGCCEDVRYFSMYLRGYCAPAPSCLLFRVLARASFPQFAKHRIAFVSAALY